MMNLRRGFRVVTNSRGEASPGVLSRNQHRVTDSRSFGAAQVRRPVRSRAPGTAVRRAQWFSEEGGRRAVQQARSG